MKRRIPILLSFIMLSSGMNAQSFSFLLSRTTDMALAGAPGPFEESSFSIGEWAEEAGFANFRVRKNLSENLFTGGSVRCFSHRKYTVCDSQGRNLGEYRPLEFSIGLFGGFKLTDRLYAAGQFKVAKSALTQNAKASCILADILLEYSAGDWELCGAILNISSGADYGNGKNEVPTSLSLFAQRDFKRLRLYSRADLIFGALPMVSIGSSYAFKEKLWMKAGAHIGETVPAFVSIGPCLKTKNGLECTLAGLFASKRRSFCLEIKKNL